MKVIISHDVDHITIFEHLTKDLIIPKFILRSSLELLWKNINFREYLLRFNDILKNKWNNIEKLMDFDEKMGIPSTFFVGVNNGLGMSYNLEQSEFWIRRIKERGFDVGVHGIAFDNFDEMQKEYLTFKELSGMDSFGIRMHYLRVGDETLKNLSKFGICLILQCLKQRTPIKLIICGNSLYILWM